MTPGEAAYAKLRKEFQDAAPLKPWESLPDEGKTGWEHLAAHAIAAWYDLQNEPIPPCQPIGCDSDMHTPYCPLGIEVL